MTAELQPQSRYSLDEYVRIAEASEVKLEFHEGRIVCMAGGTGDHSLIIANVTATIHAKLKGTPCRVYDSNLRVKAGDAVHYVYPDCTVICGPIEYDAADRSGQTALNPKLIAEVLSPSTEGYDRGDKFRWFVEVGTFEEYVLVSQRRPYVEVFTRQKDGSWSMNFASGLDATARLDSLKIDLPLADVFAGAEFPPEEPPRKLVPDL